MTLKAPPCQASSMDVDEERIEVGLEAKVGVEVERVVGMEVGFWQPNITEIHIRLRPVPIAILTPTKSVLP